MSRFATLSAELDETPATVALAWLLHQPALRAPDLELSAESLAGLGEIFPQVGPAPEAYAW